MRADCPLAVPLSAALVSFALPAELISYVYFVFSASIHLPLSIFLLEALDLTSMVYLAECMLGESTDLPSALDS